MELKSPVTYVAQFYFQLPSMQPFYIKLGSKKKKTTMSIIKLLRAVFRSLVLKPEIGFKLHFLGTVVIFCSIYNQNTHLLMLLFPPLPSLDDITV